MNSPDARQALRELLPWYENGTLAADEHREVRDLLATDLEANRQRRELRVLREVLAEDRMLSPKMMQNLRTLQARLDSAPRRRSPRRTLAWFAAAASLLLALGAGMFYAGVRTGSYHTLTATQPIHVAADFELVRVDVAAGVDAEALAGIAGDPQVRVVDGPSVHGVATIVVPREHAATVMARLQHDPRLLFVSEIPR